MAVADWAAAFEALGAESAQDQLKIMQRHIEVQRTLHTAHRRGCNQRNDTMREMLNRVEAQRDEAWKRIDELEQRLADNVTVGVCEHVQELEDGKEAQRRLDKIDELLEQAGIEYPKGVKGVSDLVTLYRGVCEDLEELRRNRDAKKDEEPEWVFEHHRDGTSCGRPACTTCNNTTGSFSG